MIPSGGQLALGTATLGLAGERADAYRLLDAYADLGGRIIDTAAVYNDWVPGETRRSEAIIGEWLQRRGRADGILVATKGAHPPIGDMARPRLDEASIRSDVEGSLSTLGVEQLDLFYLHRDDASRPVEDILGTLRALVEAGKIASVGLSNWQAERIAAARHAEILPIASNQVLGNILCRRMSAPADPTIVRLDREAITDAEASGSSLLLFSSQCGGYLSKRLASASAGPAEYRNPACAEAGARIAALAAEMGVDPTNLAVAFMMALSPAIVPVVGSRTVTQLQHSLRAQEIRLAPAQVAELLELSGL
jgi:aryl-alcohol dehydrogenase-like predicted oxidoreductase